MITVYKEYEVEIKTVQEQLLLCVCVGGGGGGESLVGGWKFSREPIGGDFSRWKE